MSEANGSVPKRFMFRGRQPWPSGPKWVHCSMCGYAWATAVDHLCTRCAFIETGLPDAMFGEWQEAQALYQRGILQMTSRKKHSVSPAQGQIGKEASPKEELDRAETVVRNVFGKQEVKTVSEFSYIPSPRNLPKKDGEELDRPAFLDPAEKVKLAEEGTEFEVYDVYYFDDKKKAKFGPKYLVKFEAPGLGKRTWSVSATGGGEREHKLAALHDHFQQPAASPVKSYLRMYDTSFGNAGFDIEFVEG